jgi:hypothetical protein
VCVCACVCVCVLVCVAGGMMRVCKLSFVQCCGLCCD